ncbi:hypothetical protein QFC20_006877 [Naganishia adeliensis]|uniref:Uncharacterized protein n=1 Tax=Naganishia adeliensis TaxID=92952 RepID=A0ACC2V7K0_9TREE|nr:hypothetical protein QFC20_006877 [Naganishia adeliensis]
MALPIEAEFANPPILTPEIEEHILHAPNGDLADDPDVQVILSPTTTIAPSIHARAKDVEAEAGEKFTLVEFEKGSGENPKEWSRAHKWFVTLCIFSLCLAAALGSAMPTGNLPAQAEELVSPSSSSALAPILLKRKAARLNKEHGTTAYKSDLDLRKVPLSTTLKIALTRPFIFMFCEPIVLCMSIYLSFIYSLLYLLFFAFPIAFEEVRGWNEGMTGTAFIAVMLGILFAFIALQYQEVLYKRATVDAPRPEARLYPMMLGSLILPIALFIFAFTGGYSWVHWIGPCVGGCLFGLAMLLVYVSANSYIVDSYVTYAASAMAAKTLMRSLAGASVPLWVTQMFHNMGFQYAGLTLALISCAIIPIPFLFFFKGGDVRKRSSRATK